MSPDHTNPTVSRERASGRGRLLLGCGLAPALFVAVMLVDGASRPGYAALHHFGSELAYGDRGWIQTANFFLTGALLVGYAAGLRHALRAGRGAAAVPLLTAALGLTFIVAGIFPTDPKPGYPPGTATGPTTLAGSVHDLNGLVNIVLLTAIIWLAVARDAGRSDRRGWVWYSIVTGIAVPVVFVITGVLFGQASAAGDLAHAYHGLVQRIYVVLGYGWLSVLAVRLLRAAK